MSRSDFSVFTFLFVPDHGHTVHARTFSALMMAVGSVTLRRDSQMRLGSGECCPIRLLIQGSPHGLVWAERVLVCGAAACYQDPGDDQSPDRRSAGTILGVTFGTGRGGTKVTPKLSFSVSVLAVVTNKVETAR